jgi:hypothetical protein
LRIEVLVAHEQIGEEISRATVQKRALSSLLELDDRSLQLCLEVLR